MCRYINIYSVHMHYKFEWWVECERAGGNVKFVKVFGLIKEGYPKICVKQNMYSKF